MQLWIAPTAVTTSPDRGVAEALGGVEMGGDSFTFGLVVSLFGLLAVVTVVLVMVLRRERRLAGWQGAAIARILSAMGNLAEAERAALLGDYMATLELITEAEEDLQEVRDYPRRYTAAKLGLPKEEQANEPN